MTCNMNITLNYLAADSRIRCGCTVEVHLGNILLNCSRNLVPIAKDDNSGSR